MSFRADDQRRYGHVPPVQYPVAGQKPDRQAVGRRLSFNTGDDAAYHGNQASDGPPTSGHGAQPSGVDELFLTSPTASNSSTGRSPFGSTNSALSGYHTDTTPRTPPAQATYNPQSFAHQPSSSSVIPHHSHSSSRYSTNSGGSFGAPPASSFAPQTYNPAAYANTNVPQRQPTYPGYGHNQDYGAAVGSGASTVYGQSPGATYPAPFPQQPLPTSPSSFSSLSSRHQTPTYDPSQYAAGFYSARGADADDQGSGTYSATQAPYPDSSHIPVGPNYEFDDTPSIYNRPFRSDSQTSPPTSPHVRPESPAGLQRHPTNAPLPSRPVDELMDEEVYWDSNGRPLGREPSIDGVTSESMMQEIEAKLGDGGFWPRRRPSPVNGQLAREQTERLHRYSPSRGHSIDYDDDDDDPEATAGLRAMEQADLDDQRFGGNVIIYSGVPATVPSNPLPPPPEEDDFGSDVEFGSPVDLGMLSGYAGNLTYGTSVGPHLNSSLPSEGSRPLPTPGYYPPLNGGYNAEVDYGGTGGLQPPRAPRLSFDEGNEERVSLHSRQSGTDSPTTNDHQDATSFYYPGLSNRPLPALPPGPKSDSNSMLSAHNSLRSQHQHHHSLSADARYYQADPEKFYQANAQQTLQPERSISLSGHSHTPQVQAPTRSRTDAAEERKKMTRQHLIGLQHGTGFPESEAGTGFPSGTFDISLPSGGRKKKFVPSKLTAFDFRKCQEPWALSGIEAWVRSMGDAENDLRGKTIEEAVTNLFTFKVPTMNVADAEMLSCEVVQRMLESGTLLPEEEWVKFGEGHISGVLWQMTGSGCYAPKVHSFESAGHCYSRQCSRSSKRMFLGSLLLEHEEENDWRVFHKLKREDYEGKPQKALKFQFNLHEIVTGERTYLYQLEIFHALYRDELQTRDPPVIHPDKIDKFLATVFRKLDTIFDINRDHLLSPLRYRRQEQAPWVVGFSDIFREWIRKAKADYLEFASGYPWAAFMIRKEADRNILFKKFIDDRQRHKLSSKQDWTHFLFQPIQRLQRYPLLLEAVEKLMIGESEERTNLVKAIQEIRAVVLECDARVAETTKRVQMMELDRMLVLRPGFQSVLNLDHLGRVLIKEGELQRMGSKGMRWVDTHALLFDHYLILAKVVVYKDGKGETKYDVSREPIPMPLLFLESMNDEPVTKQKVIATPLGRTAAAPAASTHKPASNGSGRPGLEHAATGSTHSLGAPSAHEAEGKILYPFKLKHVGYEVYTLYASSLQNRQDWCTSIIEAKTRHAKALFSQNAEPFRLRVLADASFHYDVSSVYARASGVPVKGTPLDRAIEEIESVMGSGQGIAPVCRAQVNCAAGFSGFGKSAIAIGTDNGVYVSDPSEPRGWRRTVQTARVTQIAILEEFSVCLVLTDKSLVSYPLDVVAPCSDFAPPINDNPRRAPQRLAKDVAYFATARMKDRMLVFYKRKEGLHTSFKVLEPILHKASEKRSRLFGGRRPTAGTTDTFRDFDEFYLPTECYSLSVFHTYIAVSTAKGIEMLTLDKKQPMSIPDLKAQTIANIALRIRDQRPLGMFRLNANEFILTYEDCAVYVDKHGDVSRTLIMEYTGKQKKARGATMYGQYLLLFNEDYVEVRNAENGRLRQIIAGRDVRVIDFGIRGPTGGNAAESKQSLLGQYGQLTNLGEVSKGTVKIAMCHPELPGKQIVLEMLLKDGHAE